MAVVMIGVDPHKASHTAVAISAAEEPVGQLRGACIGGPGGAAAGVGAGLAGAGLGGGRRRRDRPSAGPAAAVSG